VRAMAVPLLLWHLYHHHHLDPCTYIFVPMLIGSSSSHASLIRFLIDSLEREKAMEIQQDRNGLVTTDFKSGDVSEPTPCLPKGGWDSSMLVRQIMHHD
jgi:hypothetical protein